MNWQPTLLRALKTLDREFRPNELAYLSLTSKAEHGVRDRLAFAMQRDLLEQGYIVAREWKDRVDLAILSRSSEPLCLVELKSFLSCDLKNTTRKAVVPAAHAKDLTKITKLQAKHHVLNPKFFRLLLVAHPLSLPLTHQDGYIKYGRRMRQDPVESQAELGVLVRRQLGEASSGCWQAGEVFSIGVVVHYWLFGTHVV